MLSVGSVWKELPLFSLHGGLAHPKCFQLCLSLIIFWGKSTTFTLFAFRYAVVAFEHHHAALHSSVVFSTVSSISC